MYLSHLNSFLQVSDTTDVSLIAYERKLLKGQNDLGGCLELL